MGCLIILGIFIALAVLGAIVGDRNKTASSESAPAPAGASSGEPAFETPQESEEEPASTLTGPQSNAARTAANYISMSGFSREGLIGQLSSDAGEGYDVGDATVAVDSLNIDWNEQAVRSAKQYLSMTGFSCKGLIQQLSSSAGEKYTASQAKYGAEQAGAC
ncbi:host cell surface-exposed lipoprotein [Novosphingobium sp. ST904]|nr:host cell surface-exposed lipoprotein [Novosphingobium sp. ST904]